MNLAGLTLTDADLTALFITLKLALVTTTLLLIICTPLAWWLATPNASRNKSLLSTIIQTVVALPLILPPTVIGFYLLIAFAPNSVLGQTWLDITGSQLAFSFSGLVLGSMIYSLPFVVQPLTAAFSQLPKRQLEAAAMLGAGPVDRFINITLPLCKFSFITAATLCFAHTIGEFGVVLMIGGNIPGETQVLSIALYDHVESLQYAEAHTLAAALLLFSFILLLPIYAMNQSHLLGFKSRTGQSTP